MTRATELVARPVQVEKGRRLADIVATGTTAREALFDAAWIRPGTQVGRPRRLSTVRAAWWVISQLRTEHASIYSLARQLGTTWADGMAQRHAPAGAEGLMTRPGSRVSPRSGRMS